MRPWPLALVALIFCTPASAALPAPAPAPAPRTFHVDAAAGDDQRDGLTPATAWRSLSQVNQAPLQPGDRVLFRRGQAWRGQLRPQNGAAGAPVTYAAFGAGPKPQLLGSAAFDRPEDWQDQGNGIWATTPVRYDPVAVQADLQRSRWWLHQEGGAACTLTSPPPDAKDAPEYRLDCQQSGAAQNHIQLSATGLRVRAGEYYLLSFRARCTKPFTLPGASLMKAAAPYTAYAVTDAVLPTIGSEWQDHTIRFRARQTADDARLTFFLGGALPAGATLSLQPGKLHTATCNQPVPLSADVGNIIFADGAATGVKKWREADLRADGDYFYDARAGQVKLRSAANPATRYRGVELALSRHIIDQGGRGYVTYEGLDLRYGAAHGIGGGSTHDITVRDCDISYIGGGHQLTRPDGKPVRYGNGVEFWSSARDSLVEGCRIWEIYDAALTNQGDGTNVQENITYRRNVIWNSEYSFEYWNRGPASRTRNIRFEHNTCVNAGHGWGYTQRPDPNGRHLMFYDNTAATEGVIVRYNIFATAKDSCLRLHGRDWTTALAQDYNLWYQPAGPLVLWGKDNIDTAGFPAYQQQRRLDAHSLVADPKFLDPAHRDYRLAPDSPARRLLNDNLPAGALP